MTADAPTNAQMSAVILDPCCGSKMFHFDKNDARTIYGDKRAETHILCDGRTLEIKPDFIMDFTDMPFEDASFWQVVFDPPHLVQCGEKAWIGKKYGILGRDWKTELRLGFAECFRVLKPNGTLIFKWNETQIKVSEILALTPEKPTIGHISGKRANTHWICFLKSAPVTPREGQVALSHGNSAAVPNDAAATLLGGDNA